MQNLRSCYILIFLSCILSCSKKSGTPLKYSGKILEFTNGGGFTGAFTTIYLLDDGSLFRNGLSDTSFYEIGKIDLTTTNQQFSNYEKLGLNKMQLDEPGNRYFYITMKSKKINHKIQWGRNILTNKNPSIFFNNVMHLVKKIEEQKQ